MLYQYMKLTVLLGNKSEITASIEAFYKASIFAGIL